MCCWRRFHRLLLRPGRLDLVCFRRTIRSRSPDLSDRVQNEPVQVYSRIHSPRVYEQWRSRPCLERRPQIFFSVSLQSFLEPVCSITMFFHKCIPEGALQITFHHFHNEVVEARFWSPSEPFARLC